MRLMTQMEQQDVRQSQTKEDILAQMRKVYKEEENYTKRITTIHKNKSFVMFQLNNELKNNEKRLETTKRTKSKLSGARALIELNDGKTDTMYSTRTAWRVETHEEQ